jgi:SAM-dependent methyltransferase
VHRRIETYARHLANTAIDKLTERMATRLSSSRFPERIAYRTALEIMLHEADARHGPHDVFSGISDEYWLWLHTEAHGRVKALNKLLQGLPHEDVQLRFTSSKGAAALRAGWQAYLLFKEVYERHAGLIAECNGVLDFGCGWGRIIRFFTKDVGPANLWGVDPDAALIEWCRAFPWAQFAIINRQPPLQFADATFDLVYSFSVFSHFSEEMHASWVRELARVLRPGGMLIATTREREFIETCAKLRQTHAFDSAAVYLRGSMASFPKTDEALASYDRGEYCFAQLVQSGEWSYWGNTAIPKAYVLKHWTDELTFVDYIDDRRQCQQNVIVMQKPGCNQ